ncbi:MAG: 4-hydroxybenzoate octaprenyltransferase [Saccharospirillaceae bacterium]|nr:4-hydroxybenzoate octaprenyltransferase [Pseudomonadales bacterium]NRB79468.1 4-hydroxybenzoate octaprenyltransferase [Saccharospirillaceae bacterium]
MMTSSTFFALLRLTRLDKPIGILLLLWPTLWALWVASDGLPPLSILFIFVMGVIIMRSAGCIINDFADRKIDGKVARTKLRPLVTGEISSKLALQVFFVFILIAFSLVLFTNVLTILMSVVAVFLASLYPFMKRYTYYPQVVLGAAFSWAIVMVFTALEQPLLSPVWLLYTANLLWTVAYDTQYAMVDRDDDLKAGVKSTAILFGEMDNVAIIALQSMTVLAFLLLGGHIEAGWFYYAGIVAMVGCFGYQAWLTKDRIKQACFQAFLNNFWAGMFIFVGLFFDKL